MADEEYDLVITNGVCVTASDVGALDIGIRGDKIAVLAASGSLAAAAARRRIDAQGGYVMPGGVDCHVHLQEPSLFGQGRSADTFETGTRSAIAGGTTTIVAFAPQGGDDGDTSLLAALAAAQAKAAGACYCPFNYDNAETGKKTCITAEFPVGRFRHIPNGLPGVETRMPLAFGAVSGPAPVPAGIASSASSSSVSSSSASHPLDTPTSTTASLSAATSVSAPHQRLSPTRFVELTSTNAAKLYGLYPRKGAMLAGLSDADLVIWYPPGTGAADFTLTNSMLHHDVDYTPYEGRRLHNWPRYTILRGQVVWDRDNGGIVGQRGYGQYLRRLPSVLNDIWQTVEDEGPFDEERL